jgi:glycyl-tRNA synthetase beta chain
VNRELLLELGCEELPAAWLPGLTNQIGDLVQDRLRSVRLVPEAPVETFSTPRRLTAWVARVPERQSDLEELVTGPAVSASFGADGSPTQAARGFAAKQAVDVAALERVTTPKGEYLAFRKRQRGRAAVDVLRDVLAGTLRGLTFPKLMHWDATLDDGRGELLFGRPIRWILYSYGGRLVPFTIGRASLAQSAKVHAVSAGTTTYGHRFLSTSGRAGRAIKVRSFDEYRTRLRESFVILERGERHDKIARELDAKAQRLKGRVGRAVHVESALLDEVPDLVEYPSVIAGTFAPDFTEVLPDEVLTTTLVRHQHYFPIEDEDGRLKPAFLAVVNTEPENERTIAVNAERVVTARLRDAMFFWNADRRTPLESRRQRLSTLLFHKKVGSYLEKADRTERLAEWIARESFGVTGQGPGQAALAARLAKTDLTTDMVRELTELQGIMGGIYAREEGLPEEVWKAIYFHYLPVGVEPHAAPTAAHLGRAAAVWAAVSLADKLDTLVGLFAAGERPTGSRDPYGLRRAAQGIVKILVDLESVCGLSVRPTLGGMIEQAHVELGLHTAPDASRQAIRLFLMERLQHLMRARGMGYEEVQIATMHVGRVEDTNVMDLIRRAEQLKQAVGTAAFVAAAEAHRRAKKIFDAEWDPVSMDPPMSPHEQAGLLVDEAEQALRHEVDRLDAEVKSALALREERRALDAIASIQPAVARFFDNVRVVVADPDLKRARLSLLRDLRDAVERYGDLSVLAQKPAA